MRRRIIILSITVFVLAALGFVGYQRFYTRRAASATNVPTVAIRRGTIVATVNAAGTVAPEAQVTLSFKGSGIVQKVYVERGDYVRAGDPLARLETAQLELQVAQAEATLAINEARLRQLHKGPSAEDLASAEAALASAKASYEQIKAGPSDADLTSAIASLESAKENLARVLAGPTPAQLAAAEASLKAAQERYDELLAPLSQDEITVAQAELKRAEVALQQAQAAYDRVAWRPDIGALPQSANLQQATIDYERALANYNLKTQGPSAADIQNAAAQVAQAEESLDKLRSSPTASEIAAAQAQVAQAQAQLDKLRRSPTESELKSAAAQVAQAQAQLDKLLKGPDPDELAIAQAQVDQARAALELAKLQLQDATLVAPVDGIVVAVNAREGELISAARPMITLMDTSAYHIDLNIDEADISLIALGQEAVITLDAFPDRQLSGKVAWIDPQGMITQGVVNYQVQISLKPTDIALRPNMTANVDIAVARKEDVLLVPNQAIRRDRQGEYVEVLAGDGIRRVYVTTGLMNDEVTEIVTNLKEGDQVVMRVGPTFGFEQMMGQPRGSPFGGQRQ